MPKMFISNQVLRDILIEATEDERLAITKIFKNKKEKAYSAKKLQKKISMEGGNEIANMYRGQGTGYLDIVDDVLGELEITGLPAYSSKVASYDEVSLLNYSRTKSMNKGIKYAEKAESKIILFLLSKVYEEMTEKDKISFDLKMNDVAKKYGSDAKQYLSGTAGLIIFGNLGGFATYTFLTTTLSTLSLGTLGFGAYTAATTMLAVILGPIGWTSLGIGALYYSSKGDLIKLIRIVITVGVIRQRINYDKSLVVNRTTIT